MWAALPLGFHADENGNYDNFNRRYYEQSTYASGGNFFNSTGNRYFPKVKNIPNLKNFEKNPITQITYIWPQPLKDPVKDKDIEVSFLAARDYDSATITFTKSIANQ